MEHAQRSLRNKSNCPQMANIFNLITAPAPIFHQMPTQIIEKIAQFRKITCSHIDQLPQLTPTNSIQEELDCCRLAEEFQKFNPTDSSENSPIQIEKPTAFYWTKENLSRQNLIVDQAIVQTTPQQTRNGQRDENTGEIVQDVWKDQQFLQNLNQFVMSSGHNRIAMVQQSNQQ